MIKWTECLCHFQCAPEQDLGLFKQHHHSSKLISTNLFTKLAIKTRLFGKLSCKTQTFIISILSIMKNSVTRLFNVAGSSLPRRGNWVPSTPNSLSSYFCLYCNFIPGEKIGLRHSSSHQLKYTRKWFQGLSMTTNYIIHQLFQLLVHQLLLSTYQAGLFIPANRFRYLLLLRSNAT